MLTRLLLICVGVLIVAQTQVHAYADPGSGTLIWQMLLAVSFGVMFYLRRIIRWVRGLKAGKEKATSVKGFSAATEKESESIKG
jgi:uncharacterized membrane protein YbhN (UPF0104 family)